MVTSPGPLNRGNYPCCVDKAPNGIVSGKACYVQLAKTEEMEGPGYSRVEGEYLVSIKSTTCSAIYLKKNQNAPRPSEHPPVRGEKMSKHLGGIKGCKYKTSSWHLNGFILKRQWDFLRQEFLPIPQIGLRKRSEENPLQIVLTPTDR